jgi:hypothetical protein
MNKATIVVLSDPAGGEEALGRVFNALAAALDFRRQQRPVRIVFQGAGTRWASQLEKTDHPAHALYKSVASSVDGASAGCAVVFGARDGVKSVGMPLIGTNPVPGTDGLPSLVGYLDEGPVLTF